MPKSTPKSLLAKLQGYGYSFEAVELIGKLFPEQPLREAVRRTARFMLAAESREEVRWLLEGAPLVEKLFDSQVLLTRQKIATFALPGVSYTPDFFHILEDGRRVWVEIKANRFQPNYRDARSKLRMAATLYWFDTWLEARLEGKHGWALEEVEIDDNFVTDLHALYEQVRQDEALKGEATNEQT